MRSSTAFVDRAIEIAVGMATKRIPLIYWDLDVFDLKAWHCYAFRMVYFFFLPLFC